MQKKQSKNSKKSIDETRKMWQGKNGKKEYLKGKNYQKDVIIYISFLFLFFYLGLTTQKEVQKSITLHSHIT